MVGRTEGHLQNACVTVPWDGQEGGGFQGLISEAFSA